MKITDVQKNEYEILTELWEASVRATHDFLPEKDIEFYKPLILNEYLPAVELYCARDDCGKIHGFLGVADKKIEMLFLSPESRGEGIGKLLLNFAVNELCAVKVDVNEQNEQALKFYEHMGFKTEGRSPVDDMGKPYPLLHMRI